MKFTVMPKYQKIGLATLMSVAIILWVGIILLIELLGQSVVDVWGGLHILLKIFIILMLVSLFFGSFLTIYLISTHVEITKDGIELHFGKRVMNKMLWQDIQWVEIFCEANPYAPRQHISLSKTNQNKYKKVRSFLLQNLTKNKITFLYDKIAIDLIKEHYDRFIYGQDLIEN